MNLALDTASEQIIQREVERGHYNSPSEVIARALQLLDSEETWLLRNKEAINARMDLSAAQIERGEGMTGEELRVFLADRRANRHT